MNLKKDSFLQGKKYQIEEVLGQGGFGITYLAKQVALNRRVAIKEFFMKTLCNRDDATSQVTVGSAGSLETVERFRQKFVKEALNIAEFNHPNIIRIYDVFEENDTAYYVMEYIESGTLSDLGKISEEKALRYIRQVADALSYIHERSINHLDIKPANILINNLDNAVLIDFGLSKRYDSSGQQTSTTPVGISHGYAPVEQYKQGGVGVFSPSTDIYALGATLYKLLTGNVPPDANEVFDQGLPPMSDEISENTRLAIIAAMQPQRKNRPQSVAEFLNMLDGVTTKSKPAVKQKNEPEVVISEETELILADEEHLDNPNNKFNKQRFIKIASIVIATLLMLVGAYFGISALLDSSESPTEENKIITEIKDYSYTNSIGKSVVNYAGAVSPDTIPNGEGTAVHPDGDYKWVYKGMYENGLRNGYGICELNDTINGTHQHIVIEGTYENDVIKEGKYIDKNTNVQFEGVFRKNGDFNEGKLIYSDNTYFEGKFKNNEQFKGKMYDASGNLVYEY